VAFNSLYVQGCCSRTLDPGEKWEVCGTETSAISVPATIGYQCDG
jgi:hypothetical protein